MNDEEQALLDAAMAKVQSAWQDEDEQQDNTDKRDSSQFNNERLMGSRGLGLGLRAGNPLLQRTAHQGRQRDSRDRLLERSARINESQRDRYLSSKLSAFGRIIASRTDHSTLDTSPSIPVSELPPWMKQLLSQQHAERIVKKLAREQYIATQKRLEQLTAEQKNTEAKTNKQLEDKREKPSVNTNKSNEISQLLIATHKYKQRINDEPTNINFVYSEGGQFFAEFAPDLQIFSGSGGQVDYQDVDATQIHYFGRPKGTAQRRRFTDAPARLTK